MSVLHRSRSCSNIERFEWSHNWDAMPRRGDRNQATGADNYTRQRSSEEESAHPKQAHCCAGERRPGRGTGAIEDDQCAAVQLPSYAANSSSAGLYANRFDLAAYREMKKDDPKTLGLMLTAMRETSACQAPGIIGLGVVVVIPLVYLVLMYLTFISQV
jgi:hypothetical protein